MAQNMLVDTQEAQWTGPGSVIGPSCDDGQMGRRVDPKGELIPQAMDWVGWSLWVTGARHAEHVAPSRSSYIPVEATNPGCRGKSPKKSSVATYFAHMSLEEATVST